VTRFARYVTRRWPEPVYELRHELGLDRGEDPIFDAKHSEQLVLALFSRMLGQPQPDWPANTLISGFVFYDGDAGKAELPSELDQFLAAGPPPVVFTLGSAAVLDAGDFYEQSAQTARLLNLRAVLLVGNEPKNIPRTPIWENICIAKYAPYSKLFPRASVIVHQGGVGTTAQALRAGKPMIVMPYSHDQPDNARRVRRLGVAKVVQRKNFTAERAARMIAGLLSNPRYGERALEVQREMAREDGLKTACDALEKIMRR
jgi:UDP:flavonoid glycosyltransferase YjiC (YdhE family)